MTEGKLSPIRTEAEIGSIPVIPVSSSGTATPTPTLCTLYTVIQWSLPPLPQSLGLWGFKDLRVGSRPQVLAAVRPPAEGLGNVSVSRATFPTCSLSFWAVVVTHFPSLKLTCCSLKAGVKHRCVCLSISAGCEVRPSLGLRWTVGLYSDDGPYSRSNRGTLTDHVGQHRGLP